MSRWSPYKESLREKVAGWILGEPIWAFRDRVDADAWLKGIEQSTWHKVTEPVASGEIPTLDIHSFMMSLEEDKWVKVEFYAKRGSK
jgi:hypothetical protein